MLDALFVRFAPSYVTMKRQTWTNSIAHDAK